MATEKRIVATGHVIVGASGSQSTVLAPGQHIVFSEDDATHLAIARDISSGRSKRLEIQEVDVESEREAEQIEQDASALRAEEEEKRRLETARAAQVAAGEGSYNPEEHTVAEVIAYLKQATPVEAMRVQQLEAASERNSKQVADFEPKEG